MRKHAFILFLVCLLCFTFSFDIAPYQPVIVKMKKQFNFECKGGMADSSIDGWNNWLWYQVMQYHQQLDTTTEKEGAKNLLLAVYYEINRIAQIQSNNKSINYSRRKIDSLEKTIEKPLIGPDIKTVKTDKGEQAISYHSNGIISIRADIKNGRLNGKYERWFENGKKFEEGQYLNGKRFGTWLTFYENGKVRSKGNYNADKKEGIWEIWNADEPNRRMKGKYQNGLMQGEWQVFDGNNRVKIMIYKDDQRLQ